MGACGERSRDPEYMHSELDQLRRFLLIDGLLEIKRPRRSTTRPTARVRFGRTSRAARAAPRAALTLAANAASLLLPSRARSSRAPSRRLPSRPRQSSSRSAGFRSKLSGWSGGLLRAASPSWAVVGSGGGDALEERECGRGGGATAATQTPAALEASRFQLEK